MGGYILNFVDVLRELNGGVREKFLGLFNWFKSVERPVLVAFLAVLIVLLCLLLLR